MARGRSEPSPPLHSPLPEDKPSPRFFKVILEETLKAKKMMVPNKFLDGYSAAFLNEVNFITPNGHAWKIGLARSGDRVYFDRGWNDFVEYYSINQKYFLVFEFKGYFTFGVNIFDPSCCEIQYPSTAATLRPAETYYGCSVNVKDETSKCDFADGDCSKKPTSSKEAQVTRKHSKNTPAAADPSNPIQQNLKSTTNKQCESQAAKNMTPRRNETAIDAYRKFKTERPCFRIIFQKLIYVAYVPTKFAREHVKEVPEYFKLQNSYGSEWEVKVIQRKSKRLSFGQGWNAFQKENKLNKGDICVFELIKKNAFKVTIFYSKN